MPMRFHEIPHRHFLFTDLFTKYLSHQIIIKKQIKIYELFLRNFTESLVKKISM